MEAEAIKRIRKMGMYYQPYKAGGVLFVVAVIIKLSLQHFSPAWLIPLSEKLREYSAYKLVDVFSEGRPEQYVLLSFFYLSFVILLPLSIYYRCKCFSFKETAIYHLKIKKRSWSTLFLFTFIIFFSLLFSIYALMQSHSPAEGIPTILLNAMYSDDYFSLFISFFVLAPSFSITFIEITVILISVIMYKLSADFNNSVNQ